MLDAIERQRLERRWAFLIVCAMGLVIAALVFVAPRFLPGVDGADSDASMSAPREPEEESSHSPVESPGANEALDVTFGVREGGRE